MKKLFFAFSSVLISASADASPYVMPWNDNKPIIILDPYEGNNIDWKLLKTDKNIKGIVHRATIGMREDKAFEGRKKKAKKEHLYFGAYHLGKPNNPIEQADYFLKIAGNTKLLALDIEDDDPAKFMSLDDAQIFINRIYEKTGRYPLVYVNRLVFAKIKEKYGQDSVFAKTPLWIARFRSDLLFEPNHIWNNYTLWQFSSEINCKKEGLCLYQVPGTSYDMDINVFNGDKKALKKLFE